LRFLTPRTTSPLAVGQNDLRCGCECWLTGCGWRRFWFEGRRPRSRIVLYKYIIAVTFAEVSCCIPNHTTLCSSHRVQNEPLLTGHQQALHLKSNVSLQHATSRHDRKLSISHLLELSKLRCFQNFEPTQLPNVFPVSSQICSNSSVLEVILEKRSRLVARAALDALGRDRRVVGAASFELS